MSDKLKFENFDFATILRAALSEAHLTQKAAAELLGVPLRTMESWCRALRTPPTFTQQAVLEAVRSAKTE